MQKVRLWKVTSDRKNLVEIPAETIGFEDWVEDWLEDWLESDISALDPDLMVIGRQVPTSFGGKIDLLCLDRAGDLVVVELKKARTPRKVTAQGLEYASWVKDLTFDYVAKLANEYLKKKDQGASLESAFMERFDTELPEDLNLGHHTLVVAETIDAGTERIVRYLAALDVPINVATVQHFQDANGRRFLAQVFLIEPETVQARARSKSSRPAYLGVNALQDMADEQGIGPLYSRLRKGVRGIFFARGYLDTVAYVRRLVGGRERTMILVKAIADDAADGVEFFVHATRFQEHMGVDIDELRGWLPENAEEDQGVRSWAGSSAEERKSATGFHGYFQSKEEIDKFLTGLKSRAD